MRDLHLAPLEYQNQVMVEKRRLYCMMLSDIQNKIDPEAKWQDLKSIGRQDAMRVVKGLPTVETRYFMTLSPK